MGNIIFPEVPQKFHVFSSDFSEEEYDLLVEFSRLLYIRGAIIFEGWSPLETQEKINDVSKRLLELRKNSK